MSKNLLLQIFLILAIGTLFFREGVSAVTVTNLLTENMYTWYNANSGTTGDTNYAGTYVMTPLGDNLYIGFEKNYPSFDAGGSFLAMHNGTSLSKIGNLNEDAVYRMKASSTKLYVPGYDPTAGDDWDAGNFYIYNPSGSTFTKKRYRHASWQFVDAVTTDSNGNYTFTGLKNSTYKIKVVNPANYRMSPTNATGLGAYPVLTRQMTDSDFASNGEHLMCSGYSTGIKLGEAFTDTHTDGGLYFSNGFAAGTITNGTRNESFYGGTMNLNSTIWTDTDADGRQDPGETGRSGVRVELYSRDPYFPCAIHMPAIHVVDDNEIYVAYGYSQPVFYDYSVDLGVTFTGASGANAVFKSTDGGENWEFVAESRDGYFPYDLHKFNGELVRIFGKPKNDYNEVPWTDGRESNIARLLNDGSSYSWDIHTYSIYHGQRPVWTGYEEPSNVYGLKFPSTSKLIDFKGKLVLPERSGTKLATFEDISEVQDITVSGANFKKVLSAINDPDFQPGSGTTVTVDEVGHLNNFNTFTKVGDDYLYALGEGNKLYVTTDLRNWNTVVDFDSVGSGRPPASVEYWPNKNWIMVSTVGQNGSIYYINHADVAGETITKINNTSGLTFTNNYENVNLKTIGSTGTVPMKIYDGDLVVSEITATLSGSLLDWSSVNGDSDRSSGKSFVSNLTSVPGASSTHTLYIPIPTGKSSNSVIICPNAASLSEVATSCGNGVEFSENQTKTVNGVSVTVTKETVDSVQYWKASGVNGTGGIAVVPAEASANQNNISTGYSSASAGTIFTSSGSLENSPLSFPVSYPGQPTRNPEGSPTRDPSSAPVSNPTGNPLSGLSPVSFLLILLGLAAIFGLIGTQKKKD